MLETIAIILIILWILGLVSSYTMGGFIHLLLVVAVVVILIRVCKAKAFGTDPGCPRPRGEGFSAGRDEMSAIKIAAIVLIVAGILGLAYGKFSYTKETHEAKIGSLELSMKDKETVNVPVWAGVGAIVIGGILFFVPTKH